MHLTHKTGGGPGLEEMTDQHGRPEQAITEEQMANVSEEWGRGGELSRFDAQTSDAQHLFHQVSDTCQQQFKSVPFDPPEAWNPRHQRRSLDALISLPGKDIYLVPLRNFTSHHRNEVF